MKAIFKEQPYETLDNNHYQDGETTMCEIMEKWKNSLIEKGEKQGSINARIAVARNLLAMKQLTQKDILKATGISRAQLKKLIDEAENT